jgi:hypothetical protein
MTTDDGNVQEEPANPTDAQRRSAMRRMAIRGTGPRAGWAAAFRRMAMCGDDRLIDGEWPATDFDKTEWEW